MKLTFHPTFPKLSVLDEACKHLRFHEEIQEVAYTSGGVGFTEWFPLEYTLPTLSDSHAQRIMSHQLHKKPHECLGHQRVECHIRCKIRQIRKKRKKPQVLYLWEIIMKVTRKKSQIEGLRILILSFLAYSTTDKTPIFTFIFFPHILVLHLSAWFAHP